MNILFISEYAVHFGGVGAVIDQLCLGLKQHGHRCFLYINQPVPVDNNSLLYDDIHTGPLGAPARFSDLRQQRANRLAIRELANVAEQWRIDLVHCHEVHRSLFTAAHACQQPIIASSHGGAFHKRYDKKRVVRAYRTIADKVSCVTVLNKAMEHRIHECFGNLFRTIIIPNGIENDWLVSPDGGTPKDILLCAGRLSPDKCYELAVAAYAGSASRQQYPLVIMGEGDNESAILAEAHSHQINIVRGLPTTTSANTLYLPGYQTGSSKKALFARALLFLHPSRFEAFGIVLLEAMAQQALPICADLATYRSQFSAPDFHLCYVAEFTVADWARAIDDNAGLPTLTALGRDNYKAVSCFAWSHIFKRYLNCYQAAVADKRPDA